MTAPKLVFAYVAMFALGLTSASGAFAQSKKEDPAIVQAQKAVRKILQDPKSADFQSSTVNPNGVCGELKSKNAYGVYGETAQYAYSKADKRAYVVFANSRHLSLKSALDAYQRICGKTRTGYVEPQHLGLTCATIASQMPEMARINNAPNPEDSRGCNRPVHASQ